MSIEALEREHGADVVKHLSQALHMPAMSAAEMAALGAAFDLVPYAEASRRGCVALRGTEGDVFIVLGNPFDLDTQDWLEERLPVPFRYRLALRPDVADFLARQEASMCALDGAAAELQAGRQAKDAAQDLSFETISETDSPVVRLVALTLYALGFDADIIARMRELSAEHYGMLLVTGPTGSGKTTSLYATITEVNKGLDKIITIEDPVEYQLPGVLQIPVNEQKGLTFARGLRSILRHDPDRIMVGEIRDPETAEIAVQSALTGHLVYTTVHANNAFDVLGRFMHMGVDPYNLVSALNGVLAQRLVRVFCKPCQAKGCGECRGTGFRGRKAIGDVA